MKHLVEFLINNKSTGIIKINKSVEFVDLGLSVLWAKCNIGANEEYETGHYYQWGGLESMDDKICFWKNYPYNYGQTAFFEEEFQRWSGKLYDENGNLLPEYDIAYKTYKGSVHIPTLKEYEELFDNTSRTIEHNEEVDLDIIVYTSKINKNEIRIPCAGYVNQEGLNKVTNLMLNWTSTLTKRVFNHKIEFDGIAYNMYGRPNELYRENVSNAVCLGFTIRPVKDI